MAAPQLRTEEGIELQFGVCHAGHFLFTCLLAPALMKGAPSRVINYTSGGHGFSPVHLDDINFIIDHMTNGWPTVRRRRLRPCSVSKLHALGQGTLFFGASRHGLRNRPGAPSDQGRPQGLARHAPKAIKPYTVEQGAATGVWAVPASWDGKGGLYLEDCGIAKAQSRSPGGERVSRLGRTPVWPPLAFGRNRKSSSDSGSPEDAKPLAPGGAPRVLDCLGRVGKLPHRAVAFHGGRVLRGALVEEHGRPLVGLTVEGARPRRQRLVMSLVASPDSQVLNPGPRCGVIGVRLGEVGDRFVVHQGLYGRFHRTISAPR